MNREVRGIIKVLTATVSAFLTDVVIRVGFSGMGWFTILIVAAACFICFYRIMTDIENDIIKGGQRRARTKKKGTDSADGGNTFPGVPWSEVRYKEASKRNRHFRDYVEKI